MEPVPNFSSKFCCLGANFSIFVSKSTPFVGYGPGSVTLTSPSHTQDISFDVTRCIICQVITDYKTTSTSNGYKRMREAGEIHNDQCRAYTHSCLGPTWVGTQSMCSYLHRYWCYCHSTIYHIPMFLQYGIEQMSWSTVIALGTCPFNVLFQHMGHQLCAILPVLQSYTMWHHKQSWHKEGSIKSRPREVSQTVWEVPNTLRSHDSHCWTLLGEGTEKKVMLQTFQTYELRFSTAGNPVLFTTCFLPARAYYLTSSVHSVMVTQPCMS